MVDSADGPSERIRLLVLDILRGYGLDRSPELPRLFGAIRTARYAALDYWEAREERARA